MYSECCSVPCCCCKLQFPHCGTKKDYLILSYNMYISPSSVCVCVLFRGTSVCVEVEEVELDDGTRLRPLTVSQPRGGPLPAQPQGQARGHTQDSWSSMVYTVTFCCPQPLSLCSHITFIDHLNNRSEEHTSELQSR